MPSQYFGANVALLRLALLTFHVLTTLKRLALPRELLAARPKRLRFLPSPRRASWCTTPAAPRGGFSAVGIASATGNTPFACCPYRLPVEPIRTPENHL